MEVAEFVLFRNGHSKRTLSPTSACCACTCYLAPLRPNASTTSIATGHTHTPPSVWVPPVRNGSWHTHSIMATSTLSFLINGVPPWALLAAVVAFLAAVTIVARRF